MRTLWEYICEAKELVKKVTYKAIADAFSKKYHSISSKTLELFRSDFNGESKEDIVNNANIILKNIYKKSGLKFKILKDKLRIYPEVSHKWTSLPVIITKDDKKETRYLTIAAYTGLLNGGDLQPVKILKKITSEIKKTFEIDNNTIEDNKSIIVKYLDLRDNINKVVKSLYSNDKYKNICLFIDALIENLNHVSLNSKEKLTSSFDFNKTIDASDILVIQKNFGEILDALIIGLTDDNIEFPISTSNGLYDFKVNSQLISSKIGSGGHNPVITNLKSNISSENEIDPKNNIGLLINKQADEDKELEWLNRIIKLAVSPTIKERLVVINYYIKTVLNNKGLNETNEQAQLISKFLNTENNYWKGLKQDNNETISALTTKNKKNETALFTYYKDTNGNLISNGNVSPAEFMRYFYGKIFNSYKPSKRTCDKPWSSDGSDIKQDKQFNDWFFNRSQEEQYGFLIYHAYYKSVKSLNYIKVNNKEGQKILTEFIINNLVVIQSYLDIEYKEEEGKVYISYLHIPFSDMIFTFEPGGLTTKEPGRDKLSFKAHKIKD